MHHVINSGAFLALQQRSFQLFINITLITFYVILLMFALSQELCVCVFVWLAQQPLSHSCPYYRIYKCILYDFIAISFGSLIHLVRWFVALRMPILEISHVPCCIGSFLFRVFILRLIFESLRSKRRNLFLKTK